MLVTRANEQSLFTGANSPEYDVHVKGLWFTAAGKPSRQPNPEGASSTLTDVLGSLKLNLLAVITKLSLHHQTNNQFIDTPLSIINSNTHRAPSYPLPTLPRQASFHHPGGLDNLTPEPFNQKADLTALPGLHSFKALTCQQTSNYNHHHVRRSCYRPNGKHYPQ